MSKIERRNKARQHQLTKNKDVERETRVFRGKDAAPRIVAVVPLCEDVSSAATIRSLMKSLDIEGECPENGIFTTWYAPPSLGWPVVGGAPAAGVAP